MEGIVMTAVSNKVFKVELAENLSELKDFGNVYPIDPTVDLISSIPIKHIGEEIGYLQAALLPEAVKRHVVVTYMTWLGTPIIYATPEAIKYHTGTKCIGPILAHEIGHLVHKDRVSNDPELTVKMEIEADKYSASIYGTEALKSLLEELMRDIPEEAGQYEKRIQALS